MHRFTFLLAMACLPALLTGCESISEADPSTKPNAAKPQAANVKAVYVKVPDGTGETSSRTGELEDLATGHETHARIRFRVSGSQLTSKVEKAAAGLIADGYRIASIVPVARGYAGVSETGYALGGGYGYGVSPTDRL